MVAYTYSRVAALNFNTTPASVAKSATGSVYAVADTTFTTPLNITLVVGGVTTTSISADANGFFPDFTVNDRTSVVWKQNGSSFTSVLTTTDPVPGPKGDTGNAGAKGDKGDPGDLSPWQENTYYPLNKVISSPTGVLMRVTTAHTSGASYDATKFAEAVPDRLTETALSATILDQVEAPIAEAVAPKLDAKAVGRRSSDAVTSWWCTPRAHYDDMRQRVYFSGCSRSGLQSVGYFDLREKNAHTFPLGAYEADDHNTPAMLIEDDKPPIVLLPRHGQEAVVRYRKGTTAHALDTLGPERTIPFAGATSYGHIIRRPGTNTIAVLTRDEGASAGLAIARSTDYGETWETSFRLFGSGYITFRQMGNILYGVASTHPVTGTNSSCHGFYIDLSTGDVFNHHSGTAVSNIWTTTTVISSSNLTLIRQNMDTDTPNNTTRVFDVGPSGSVAGMDFHKSTPHLGGTYKVFRKKSGGVWTAEPLTTSGVPLGYNASSYVGGMQFGATDNEILLCRESSGTWTLERWTTTAAGQPWSLSEVLETRTDGRKLGRPITPRKGESAGFLVLNDYHRYMPDNYYDYMADQTLVEY